MASLKGNLEELLKPLSIIEPCGKFDCRKCTRRKQIMDHDYLNKYQRKAYNEIVCLLDENKNAVITVDAPSGTGKTFLLSTFAATYNKQVKFIVFRKDQASEVSFMGIDTYTYVSFNMYHFNLPYYHAIRMFNAVSTANVGELYKLIVYAKKFVMETKNIIVLDTYTVPSPAMLLLLYIVSIKCDLHIIFAGNSIQLGAVGESPFHNESNFYIVQMLSDLTINKLATNMRTCDILLDDKISQFRKVLREYKPAGNIQFNFHLRYFLYTLFRLKYFTEECFDSVYIAPTHRNVTSRLNRFIRHLQSIGRPYVEVPFFYKNKHGFVLPLCTTRKGKFCPFLLLVEGYKYIYITTKGIHHVVRLENLLFRRNQLHSALVRFVNDDNHVEEIQQCWLTYYQILPDYRAWLLRDVVHTDELWQFPLRPYMLTYHAALGRTIDKENVELNIDCTYANSVYTGLSSVRHYYNIHKIHSDRDLLGYVITEYMEKERNDDRYYYCCPLQDPNRKKILEYVSNEGPNKFIDSIEWIDANGIDHFESKKPMSYIRIERSTYNQSNKILNTPLMKVARFVKEKPTVILKTMNMAAPNDFTGLKDNNTNKNRKQKQQQRENEQPKESDAYVYLRNEYTQWIRTIEKQSTV